MSAYGVTFDDVLNKTAAPQRASRGQPPHGGQPTLNHWVAQGWVAEWASRGLGRLASSEPTLLSPDPPLSLLAFCFTGSVLHQLMPPLCLLQWHRVNFQASDTGWLVEAGLLCVNPPPPMSTRGLQEGHWV